MWALASLAIVANPLAAERKLPADVTCRDGVEISWFGKSKAAETTSIPSNFGGPVSVTTTRTLFTKSDVDHATVSHLLRSGGDLPPTEISNIYLWLNPIGRRRFESVLEILSDIPFYSVCDGWAVGIGDKGMERKVIPITVFDDRERAAAIAATLAPSTTYEQGQASK